MFENQKKIKYGNKKIVHKVPSKRLLRSKASWCQRSCWHHLPYL